ncbi:hypothetical protein IFT69_26670 [Pseudomonas putida]|nr:hypothetical protein [Pseudomonas putida]
MRNILASIVLMLFFSLTAQAEQYQWFYEQTPKNLQSSADAACRTNGESGDYGGNIKYKYDHVEMVPYTPDEAYCFVMLTYTDGRTGMARRGSVLRIGDSCPASTTYNSVTGGCDAPSNKCSANKGKTVQSFHWLSSTDEPTSTISIDGCAAAVTGMTICKTASPSVFSCTGTATWSGEELLANSGQGKECTGEDCAAGQPEDSTKNDPCIKQQTATGFTCTSKIEDSKVGQTNCGTANGVFVCTPEVKPVKITQTQQVTSADTQNADGSITNKNITKTTKTVCVADKCTDTSYTTTTASGKSSQGMPTGTSVSCVGGGCEAQTGGGGTVGQIGGGGGSNDNKDGKATEQKDCSKPIECEGDIYQCAILKQDYISYCSMTQGPTEKQLDALKAETATFQDKLAQNQTELDAKAASVLNQFKSAASGGGGGGGKCLPDYAVGYNITMRFSATCEYLVGIRYAILCIAFIIAARRISREL